MSLTILSGTPLKGLSPLAQAQTAPLQPAPLGADEFVPSSGGWSPPRSAALLAAVCSLAGCAATPTSAPPPAVEIQVLPPRPVEVKAEPVKVLEALQQAAAQQATVPEEKEPLDPCPVRLCSRVLRYDRHIEAAAEKFEVDPNLIRGVIAQESQGFPNAGSPKGAKGLMQLMPVTARELGVRNRGDARQNVMGGTRYLAQLLRENDGDVERALWAYNAGPGNLAKGVKPAETRHYIPAVQEYARQFEAFTTR